ncbi:hypothetical protein SUGI_0977730 [Cryptomeria japonica]|nr:hypothetical protein SUGI_0977730 [Cryptomeria japonica]
MPRNCFLRGHYCAWCQRRHCCDGRLSIRVETGRRDSTSAYASEADRSLGSATDAVTSMVSRFQEKGFTEKDMACLLGAHSVGKPTAAFSSHD